MSFFVNGSRVFPDSNPNVCPCIDHHRLRLGKQNGSNFERNTQVMRMYSGKFKNGIKSNVQLAIYKGPL